MALDNLDPNIPLQAGNIQIGNPQQLNAILAMQLRAQQLRQMQQSENALRQLYATPGNLDEQGRPTANALRQIGQISPQTAFDVQNHLAQLDERKLRAEVAQGQIGEQHRKAGYEIGQDVLNTYESTLKDTGDPKIANQRAMERRAELLDQASKDGSLPSRAVQNFMPWDPIKYRSAVSGYQASQQKPPTPYQQAEIGFKTRDEARKDAEEQRAQRDERRKQAAFERGATEKPENIAVTKPDGTIERTTGFFDKDRRQWVTSDGTNTPIEGQVELSSKSGGAQKAHPAREIGVVDKDGNVIERVAANEVPQSDGTTKWFRTGTNEEVKQPAGGHIDVGQAAGVVMGSREAQMLQRQLGSGVQALKALRDIVQLPSTASRGFFGGREQGKGLLDAAKETLTNSLTTQEVQAYNAITPGVTKALAFIDSQGLAPGVNFTNSFKAEMLAEGDQIQTKMLKLARQREIIEGGMETLLTNPRLAAEQKKKAEEVLRGIAETIPWTPIDVIQLMRADNPKATLRDVAGKEGLSDRRQSAPSPPQGGQTTPSGMRIYQP